MVLSSFNYKVVDTIKIVIKDIVFRSSFIVSGPENLIKKNYIIIRDHISLYGENQINRDKLRFLEGKDLTNQILKLENTKYKKLIDDYFIKNDEIYAKVLIDKQSPFLKSLILNKGSRNNIRLGMVVLDDTYLVGKVVEVNFLTSRVLLLPDINSKIPVTVQPGDFQAIMSGNGNQHGIFQYIKNSNFEKNEEELLVITSGAGGLFKSGIPVGKILKRKGELINKNIKVEFKADFSQLKYVRVISFSKEQKDLDQASKKDIEAIENKITEMEKQKETLRILLEQKKIEEEVRARLEKENLILKINYEKSQKELSVFKEKLAEYEKEEEEVKFQKLNLVYKKKCKKTFYNKLYLEGTPEYKNCILNKGKKN